ncbi:precorrin-6A/cobalt-precorrin-6A reductase [Thiohalospira halophila DSM 15071]|uniref:Precorrin-6A/cobalt-precorrin-6A reductase n=1 Tax=Thiohalospira halophila DSM 15071 TaxID=1123397 RepID=A0A1I1Q4P1_9GAMM|nr:cobalt-precorrin-6A reductase [Thiohalospira halophila]SFD16967.1 precorrin-6A/cobalt-precorrin-6A reductase [Thiohalospira halophila DSM 15071]
MHVLLLAGTAEARELAGLLADHPRLQATASLAGRVRRAADLPVTVRTGGFGGIDGLAAWLREQAVGAVVDATHPFAAGISANAAAAARAADIPLAALVRPAWEPRPGDDWRPVADLDAAVAALRPLGERVLVTTGRNELAPFEAAPEKDYVIRTIDPPEPPPALPRARYIQARGPFDAASEAALMAEHDIQALVTKASGGEATRGKLDAARERGIPVVMVERPPLPAGVHRHCTTPGEALAWLEGLAAGHDSPSCQRGV